MKPKILIVDGHSAIFASADLSTLHARHSASARERLIHSLTRLQDSSDWTVAVVFDGRGAKATSAGEPYGIAVFYSKSGQTADSLIERLVVKYAPGHEVTVATNDHMERTTAESFGGSAISIEQLAGHLREAEGDLQNTLKRLRR
jgi:predicted RNA-binding protein with PIN domain